MRLRQAMRRAGGVWYASTVTTAAQAIRRVLGYLEPRLQMDEQLGAGRGPWLMMAGIGATRGQLHCYAAAGLDKVAFLTLEDDGQLEAATLIAFSESSRIVPHLYVDAALVGRDYAVFVDLVPRVDLAVHPEYVAAVYAPLSSVFEGLSRHPRLRRADVPRSLVPYVSPWMTGFRVERPMMSQLFELVAPYVSHWLALHQGVVAMPAHQLDHAALKLRDERHRESLFSREADPAWDALGTLVGAQQARRTLELLRAHGIPISYSLRPPPADP